MDETVRRRSQAWAGLVEEVAARPTTVQELMHDCPTLARRTREARASATMARQALAKVVATIELQPRDATHRQMLRAWSGCVDEILQLTERLCAMAKAA
jgi:hypothetical protein